jgi:sucrose-phosphate synthase
MITFLASDIDNTLTGDLPALQALSAALQQKREAGELFLALSTGRRLAQVLAGFTGESLPEADAIISQVGTEIYLPPFREEMEPLAEWDEQLHRHYSRERALAFLEGIEGLEMQPQQYNTPLKVSAYLHRAPDPEAAAARVRRNVVTAGKADHYRVVWSSGMHLDILPAAAGKGNALHYLLDYLAQHFTGYHDLSPRQVLVAGDSGNDLAMFAAFERGIVVANAQPELKALAEQERPQIYFARASYAAGVAEGLQHFKVLP